MTICATCGRQNEDGSRFCMDCGKPLSQSAVAMPMPAAAGGSSGGLTPATRVQVAEAAGRADATCASCGKQVDSGQPFCAFCGAPVKAAANGPALPPCPKCGKAITDASYKFCPHCASPLGRESTALFSASRAASGGAAAPRPSGVKPPVTLVQVSEDGTQGGKHPLTGEETTIGRGGADIGFPDDAFLSPMHALFLWKDGKLSIRDLGSRNGTWIFLDGPHRLVDGDLILIGSQLLRFRRLGYPGPHPPDADSTRRMGSLVPSADIASLGQLRADGSVRDVIHLSPGRDVTLGRDKGDWPFPYDPSMSGAHALVKSEDADFVLQDAGSRNGVAVAARGDVQLKKGSKILVGDKQFLIEMT